MFPNVKKGGEISINSLDLGGEQQYQSQMIKKIKPPIEIFNKGNDYVAQDQNKLPALKLPNKFVMSPSGATIASSIEQINITSGRDISPFKETLAKPRGRKGNMTTLKLRPGLDSSISSIAAGDYTLNPKVSYSALRSVAASNRVSPR